MVLLLTTINVSAGALVLTARSAPAAAIVVLTARGASSCPRLMVHSRCMPRTSPALSGSS